jgi:hypothetical protein
MHLRTGFAYWPLRNGILASYPSLDRDETADVAIIGAGVTGAGTRSGTAAMALPSA